MSNFNAHTLYGINHQQPAAPASGSVYNRDSGNPLHPQGGSQCWRKSEFALKDRDLRIRSGVAALDTDVTVAYTITPDKTSN